MAKTKKLLPLKVGCLVALNDLEDPWWFEVMEIDGFVLTIRQFDEKIDYAHQTTDKSLVKQVKYRE